MLFAEGKD